MRFLFVAMIRGYRWFLSPLKSVFFGPGAHCRHVPTCSVYAEVAFRRHGSLRGGALSLRRLVRCHPWGTEGWDPVPTAPGYPRKNALKAEAPSPSPLP